MSLLVDLNCDMGESFGAYTIGADEQVMPFITSANVACGFHAGDPLIMRRTVRLARQHGVSVGAHPGFRDLAGFGRRDMACTPDEIYGDVLYQVGALAAVCRTEGVRMNHVKPHGALYNLVSASAPAAGAVVAAVVDFDPGLIVFALPGSELHKAGEAAGLQVACEVFGDRLYTAGGGLVSRGTAGAVLEDQDEAAAQVRRMILEGKVRAITGEDVPIRADTICVHGDSPHAAALVQRIRAILQADGVMAAAPRRLL